MADLPLHTHGEGDCLLLAKTAAELSISRDVAGIGAPVSGLDFMR